MRRGGFGLQRQRPGVARRRLMNPCEIPAARARGCSGSRRFAARARWRGRTGDKASRRSPRSRSTLPRLFSASTSCGIQLERLPVARRGLLELSQRREDEPQSVVRDAQFGVERQAPAGSSSSASSRRPRRLSALLRLQWICASLRRDLEGALVTAHGIVQLAEFEERVPQIVVRLDAARIAAAAPVRRAQWPRAPGPAPSWHWPHRPTLAHHADGWPATCSSSTKASAQRP